MDNLLNGFAQVVLYKSPDTLYAWLDVVVIKQLMAVIKQKIMLKRILFTSIWLNITLKISLIQDPTQALSSLTLITGKRES